jgi:hypothetical protein
MANAEARMKHGSTPGATSIGMAAVAVALAATWACVPKAAHRQTDVMEKSGTITVSAAELRALVNALGDRFADQVEETADRVGTATPDPAVRRRALAFKIDAVPAVYTAAYRADPMAALVDLWALAFQLNYYLREGAGRDSFGAGQGVARDGARELVAEADLVARRAARAGEFDRARGDVEAWARRNPVRYTFSSRPTCATFAAERRAEGRDAFVAIGSVSDTVEAVSERLNTYAALEPKLARWQAELLLSESAGERSLEAALGDVGALGAAARRAQEVLDHAPDVAGAASAARAVLAEERRAALDSVNAQRLATLEYATSERLAVLAALREERLATLASLRQERIEGLQEVDAIKTRAVETAVGGLKEVVDHAIGRLAVLLLVFLVAAAALGTVSYRLTVGRHR